MGKRLAKKVLLIGWDAADWKVINPLMDAGHMPTLEKLVNNGVMGNIATLDPPLSPMLWTSIATGKRPYKHGIHGFSEVDPSHQGIRPIFASSRKVKAIWNILTQHNLKTHVLGWWPSHPAEPINGISISNFYQQVKRSIDKPWPMMDKTVHPLTKVELFKKLRVHPEELTAAHVTPFIPMAKEIQDEKDKKKLSAVMKMLAECTSLHSAATYILENEEWDFLGLYLDSIDHFCHGFMRYHPPKQDHIDQKQYDLFNNVVNAAYMYHDMMLERLIQLAGPDATIMLISDHGFYPDHNRLKVLPKEPAAPALEHSPYGIICLKGPNIKKDEIVYGSSVLDVTPTLLTLFGLPIGADMDGKVIINAFEEPVDINTIPSWEDIPGNAGTYPPNYSEDSAMAKEALNQLIDLGYIEKPDEDIEKAMRQTENENNYNLARAYIDGQKFNEAIKILEELIEKNPDTTRYMVRLAMCYQQTFQKDKFKNILKQIKEKINQPTPSLDIMEGVLLLHENEALRALKIFQKIESEAPETHGINMQLGRGYLQLKRWDKAIDAFSREIEKNKENAPAYHGLGVAYLRKGQPDRAIDLLLNSIGLSYYFPFAHYHLGEALMQVNKYEEAAHAFKVCLQMSPNINKAREGLVRIYSKYLKDPEQAEKYLSLYNKNIQGEIIIVSGLPRSGTSMMMQMLEKGGIPIFTDKRRKADENNPKGYYEHEAVKTLRKNKSWLKDADGKAIKVISHLLTYLPANFDYKVVFMQRDIQEIMESQLNMLKREGKSRGDFASFEVINNYQTNLKKVKSWAEKQKNIDITYVNYKDVVSDPISASKKISEFLGGKLDENLMARVIDKNLYRERIS